RPVLHSSFNKPALRLLSGKLLGKLRWDRCGNLQQAKLSLRKIEDRLDPIQERLDAYIGWLLGDPEYQRDEHRAPNRWGLTVRKLGYIPAHPVEGPPTSGNRSFRKQSDVTAFVNELQNFYAQWRLRGLATWDLPEPETVNLSGLPLPESMMPPTN